MTFQPTRREALSVGLGTLLLPAMSPSRAADGAPWEFFEPRPREFSRVRRREAPTMAIVFGGKPVNVEASWDRLSDAERAAVLAIQPASAPETKVDEPPYPRIGLKPMLERLRVVRGPVGQPLRVHLEVDELGALSSLAVSGQVQKLFGHEMFALLRDAAFKPGVCGGKACTSVLSMDIVYLGEA